MGGLVSGVHLAMGSGGVLLNQRGRVITHFCEGTLTGVGLEVDGQEEKGESQRK